METNEILDNTVASEDDSLGVSVVAVDKEGTSKNPSSDSEHDTED